MSKFSEIGASGLNVLAGRINEEFLPQLSGDKAITVWREMGENDSYTGALLYGLLHTVLRVDWTIDLNEAAVGDGDFLESARNDMSHPWRDVVAEGMTMAQYGWSWLETVYKLRQGPDASPQSDYDDQRLGWRKMPLRSQNTRWQWSIDEEGGIEALIQRISSSDYTQLRTAEIPIEKSLLFRTTHHKNNPEGRSVLRSGYRAWFFRKRIEEIEAIGIERDLAGLPVISIPAEMLHPSAPDDMKAAVEEFKRMGRNIRNDKQSFVLMPMEYDPDTNGEMYKFELASTNGRRLFDTTQIINRWAAAQLMSIMADVMMLGHEAVGSLALSRTKAQLFTAGVQAMVDELCDVLNRFAVARLFRLNGIAPPWPKLVTSPVERIDPGDFVAMILQYSQSGAPLWPDDNLDTYIRTYLGLPAREEDGSGLAAPKTKPNDSTNPTGATQQDDGPGDGSGGE